MLRRSLALLAFLVALPSLSPAQQDSPTFKPGRWVSIQLAIVGNRLVVFASDDGKWYFKTHDLRLSDVTPEGHICFQHEEHGNATGASFDAVVLWDLDKTFDIDQFAAPKKRLYGFRPGSASFSDDFSRSELRHLVPVHGDWKVEDGRLWCPGNTAEWARIRTEFAVRDFMLAFKLFRAPSESCNWAGVALRTGPDGIGFTRVIALSGPAGDRLAVWPVQAQEIENQNEAALAAKAKAEQERQRQEHERRNAVAARYTKARNRTTSTIAFGAAPLIVGDIQWTVTLSRKLGSVLKSDNPYIADVKAGGQFIEVRIRVENTGARPRTLVPPVVFDDRGRTFDKSIEADRNMPVDNDAFLRNLNPNVPVDCSVIYDVAPDSTGLALLVGDLVGSTEGAIDLGL